MKPKPTKICEGCEHELAEAYYWQSKGYHIATSLDYPMSYNFNKDHYGVILVNDNGKIFMM